MVIKAICINELSYPLPRPVNIGKTESRLYIWNTMMAMRSEWQKDYDELQKYKAIEEDLGIDLVTLMKAITGGFYVNVRGHKGMLRPVKVSEFDCELRKEKGCGFCLTFKKFPHAVKLDDYGKNSARGWALTKEELK